MACTSCHGPVETTSPDPDHCQGCCDRIDEMCRNPMAHARAARTILECREFCSRPDVHMRAFLAVFHPGMDQRQVQELARSVR